MLQFIDDQLAKFWHVVLVGLCKLTGRNNFFFAYVMTLLCGICFVASLLLVVQKAPIWYWPMYFLAFFAVGLLGQAVVKEIKNLEESLAKGNDTVILSPLIGRGVGAVTTLTAMIVGLINSYPVRQTPYLVIALGMVFLAGAMYFAADFQKPQKTIFRKGLDWLKAHKPLLSWGGHTPQPTAG